MTRHVILMLGFFSVLLPHLNAQSPAARGTLADYLNLPESGVRLAGDLVASNFRLLPRQQGASGFRSDFIDVVPVDNGSQERGFRFEVMDGATASDFFQLRLSFDLAGASLTGGSLSLMTANLDDSSNAGIDAVLSLNSPGQSRVDLITFLAPGGAGSRFEAKTFSSREPVSVELDVVLDGGGTGRPGEVVASVGSVRTLFQSPSPPAPSVPVVIERVELSGSDLLVLFFRGAENREHILLNSPDLSSDFSTEVSPSGGSLITGQDGEGRLEIYIGDLGGRHFFRLLPVTP